MILLKMILLFIKCLRTGTSEWELAKEFIVCASNTLDKTKRGVSGSFLGNCPTRASAGVWESEDYAAEITDQTSEVSPKQKPLESYFKGKYCVACSGRAERIQWRGLRKPRRQRRKK